jgi:hypothetical protein
MQYLNEFLSAPREIQNLANTAQNFRSSAFNLCGLCQQRREKSITTVQNFRSQYQHGMIHDLISYLGCVPERGAGVSDHRDPSLSFSDMLTHSNNRSLDFLDCERPPRVSDFRVDRRLYVGETSRGIRTRPGAESGDARVRPRHAR